jgi:hypothetical protein
MATRRDAIPVPTEAQVLADRGAWPNVDTHHDHSVACPLCGAVVASCNRGLHIAWHERLAERLLEAL